MRKYIDLLIIGLVFITIGITGCYEQEVVDPISPNGYPGVTISTDFTGSELHEGDTIRCTATIDKQLDVPLTFSAHVISGTASDDDFIVVEGQIAAYTSETEFMIIVDRDYAADIDETVKLEVGVLEIGQKYLLNPTAANPITLDFTIKNYVSNELEMVFAWDKDIFVNYGYPEFPTAGENISTCAGMDFDIFIADAEGFDLNDPWATFNPAVMAATGDCPEVMTFSDLDDGSYVIFSELWYNAFADLSEFPDQLLISHNPVPITATFVRQGVFEISIEQDPSQVINSDTPGGDNVEYNGEVIDYFVAGVTISTSDGYTTYTVTDFEGTQIAKGKVASSTKIRLKRPTSLIK